MSRAPYNTTALIYPDLDHLFAEDPSGEIPCRFVPTDQIVSVTGFFPLIVGYLTTDTDTLYAGDYGADAGVNLVWNIPSANFIRIIGEDFYGLAVQNVEMVSPTHEPVYYRAWLMNFFI